MVVDFKQVARLAGIALLALAIWFIWWSRPERQVRRAQGRLLSALGSRDYPSLARLFAEDYRDTWDHDKAIVLGRLPQVLDQFILLDFDGEIRAAEPDATGWMVQQKIIVSGMGGALGMAARDEVNRLKQPFTMRWRKRTWKPWDWELIEVQQPELRIPGGW